MSGEPMLVDGSAFRGRDASFDWIAAFTLPTVTIDLNIVYDSEQYTDQQARDATAATVEDLKETFKPIGIEFNVTYSPGTRNESDTTTSGEPTRIATGQKDRAINVFLFVNNKSGGKSGGMYAPNSKQIFLWEGSMDANPRSKNVSSGLSVGALAHEVGHLFFDFAGVPMNSSLANNISQDAGIAYAFFHMRYNPVFVPDPELPDSFDFNKTGGGMAVPKIRKTESFPTYEQLLRLGARRVRNSFAN
jgi:hypothetical protein